MMGRDCWGHVHPSPVPLGDHHGWPLGGGGANGKADRGMLCSNAHSSTHDLLDKMRKAEGGAVPWTVRRLYGWRVRKLALAGMPAGLHITVEAGAEQTLVAALLKVLRFSISTQGGNVQTV